MRFSATNFPFWTITKRQRLGSLLTGTALGMVVGLGYGRGSYAQTITFSGTQTDPQGFAGPGVAQTSEGFSVDADIFDGIIISGIDPAAEGDTVFVDNFYSSITGADSGINAVIDGKGALRITTTGDVTGRSLNGISARTTNNLATDLTISAANVTGQLGGMSVRNYGAGDLAITSNGVVSGETDIGIYARGEGQDLSIDVATVSGGRIGVFARNTGSGELSISTSGEVTGQSVFGIYARNYGTDLTINAATATGGIYGISARNYGSGALNITTSGKVMGQSVSGIYARNYGTDLTINAATVTGGVFGISARSFGSGALSITTSGEVTGQSVFGIYARNYGTDLTINAATATGGVFGINARSFGSGALSITTSGEVTGQSVSGIYARNYGTDLTINAATATGGIFGISARNYGSGALSITANGAVTGGTGDGIYATNASTEDLTITIAEGGSVSTGGTGAGDFAIDAGAPQGSVIVKNFGTVTGRVNLTNSNVFTNSGTWDLAGTTSNFNATGDSRVENSGLIIAASDAATNETSAIDNLDTFRNNAQGTIRLADGDAGDIFRLNADSTGAVGSGAGNFIANGGTIELDVVLGGDGSAADRLDVSGDVVRGGAPTALSIRSTGGSGGTTKTGIEVVSVGGRSDAGAFVLAGPVEVGALAYDLSLGDCTNKGDQNWYLCNNGKIGTTGAAFEALSGVVLGTFVRNQPLQQRLNSRQGSRATISTKGTADLPVSKAVDPWFRAWGDFADITPKNSRAVASYETDSWGFDAGLGVMLGESIGGDLVGSVNLRYSASYTDLSNPVGSASVNAKGFGVGAGLTWFGDSGFYFDLNGALDFISIDAASQGGGQLLDDYDDVVYSASAEVGKRIALDTDTTLLPSLQVSWGKLGDGNLIDQLGNVIHLKDRESLDARLGLSVERSVASTAWGSGNISGFGNILYDLEGSRSITVAGTDLIQSGSGNWAELGAGFSLNPTPNANLFGQVSYREALDGVNGEAMALSAGFRMQW